MGDRQIGICLNLATRQEAWQAPYAWQGLSICCLIRMRVSIDYSYEVFNHALP